MERFPGCHVSVVRKLRLHQGTGYVRQQEPEVIVNKESANIDTGTHGAHRSARVADQKQL